MKKKQDSATGMPVEPPSSISSLADPLTPTLSPQGGEGALVCRSSLPLAGRDRGRGLIVRPPPPCETEMEDAVVEELRRLDMPRDVPVKVCRAVTWDATEFGVA